MRAFLPPWISGIFLSSGSSWQSTASQVLTLGVGEVEGSVFCLLCLARAVLVHLGLESPNTQRQPSEGGGDGVPAAASPETLGDPSNSWGRAGTRTRPHFPVSMRYFRPRVRWAGARTWQETVEAVVGARFPLPLSTSPQP